MMEQWYVYILRCRDDTLYCGITPDLNNRIKLHNCGKGAKYTRGRGPVELIYTECFPSRSDASKREAMIKRFSRAEKLELIAQYKTAAE
jgi:putative endonuclease